jgi:catechol 2,3-dioxygenase-like lactoylglutathione lyase family enzyme
MADGVVQLARLAVADLDRSVTFYERMFGFKPLHTMRFHDPVAEETVMADASGRPAFAAIASGHLDVTATKTGSPLVISVDDIQGTYDELVAAGAEIPIPLAARNAMSFFVVRDPDGYNLEIVPSFDSVVMVSAPSQPNPAYTHFGHTGDATMSVGHRA